LSPPLGIYRLDVHPEGRAMNAPIIDRSVLLRHVHAIEEEFPLTITGLLPRGAAAHVFGDDAVDFLAEKKPGLSLLDLCKAEVELSDRLGRPVGIVLRSGLKGSEAKEFPALAKPL
jgi:predicted nucleotidyltransferase